MHASLSLCLRLLYKAPSGFDVESHPRPGTRVVTLAVRLGQMIYGADFLSAGKLKVTDFVVGERARAGVEHAKKTV